MWLRDNRSWTLGGHLIQLPGNVRGLSQLCCSLMGFSVLSRICFSESPGFQICPLDLSFTAQALGPPQPSSSTNTPNSHSWWRKYLPSGPQGFLFDPSSPSQLLQVSEARLLEIDFAFGKARLFHQISGWYLVLVSALYHPLSTARRSRRPSTELLFFDACISSLHIICRVVIIRVTIVVGLPSTRLNTKCFI